MVMMMVAVVMATAVVPRAAAMSEPLPSSSVSAVPSAAATPLAALRAALAIPSPPELPSAPRTLPTNEPTGAMVAGFGISVPASADRADPSRASTEPQCPMKVFSKNHPSPQARKISLAGFLLLPVLTTFRFRNSLISLPKTPPLSRRSGLTRCFRSGIGPNTGSSSRSPLLPPRGGFSLTPHAPGVPSTASARMPAIHMPPSAIRRLADAGKSCHHLASPRMPSEYGCKLLNSRDFQNRCPPMAYAGILGVIRRNTG